MRGNFFALMVHERPEPCQTLKPLLRRLGIDTFSVTTSSDAAHLLEQTHPHLLFIDRRLPDGTWVDVLNLASDAPAPICAVLVGNSGDTELVQATLNYHAFDCVSPPFDIGAISKLLQRAIRSVQAGREYRARSAVA